MIRLDVEELKGVGPMIDQVEDQVSAQLFTGRFCCELPADGFACCASQMEKLEERMTADSEVMSELSTDVAMVEASLAAGAMIEYSLAPGAATSSSAMMAAAEPEAGPEPGLSFYYECADDETAETSLEALGGLVESGAVSDATRVWMEGLAGWVSFAEAKQQLADVLGEFVGTQKPEPAGKKRGPPPAWDARALADVETSWREAGHAVGALNAHMLYTEQQMALLPGFRLFRADLMARRRNRGHTAEIGSGDSAQREDGIENDEETWDIRGMKERAAGRGSVVDAINDYGVYTDSQHEQAAH